MRNDGRWFKNQCEQKRNICDAQEGDLTYSEAIVYDGVSPLKVSLHVGLYQQRGRALARLIRECRAASVE